MSSARDDILGSLRQTLSRPDLRFPPPAPEPLTRETRMTVTEAKGDLGMLAQRFGEELEALHGSYEIAETASEARLALINRLVTWMETEEQERKGAVVSTGQEHSVLAWDPDKLPIENLSPSLQDLDLKLVAPHDLYHYENRDGVRHIRYGITGVAAAFASTGSMLMIAGEGASRAASLLPYRHIALIPFSCLYPTMEDWLAHQVENERLLETFRTRANLAMISGPSKSADIEMNLTLGVHGPRYVHAILFDDMPVDMGDRVRPSDFFDDEDEEGDGSSGGFDPEETDPGGFEPE